MMSMLHSTHSNQPRVRPRPIVVPNVMSIENQNRARLRINRIALVQDLKVEHVLSYLEDNGVINENDKVQIEFGTTPQDKARILIDLLPNKGGDWYRQFKASLKAVDVDTKTKKKYQVLIEFLDNSIIHKPISPAKIADAKPDSMKLPKYAPLPSISPEQESSSRATVTFKLDDDNVEIDDNHVQSDTPKVDKETVELDIESIQLTPPDNFKSLIETPEDHFNRLEESSRIEDKQQLLLEKGALENMKEFEVAYALHKRQQLPKNSALLLTKAVQSILFDRDSHHLYFKYFTQFRVAHQMDLCKELGQDYLLMLSKIETVNFKKQEILIKLGFHLVDFLQEYGVDQQARMVLNGIQQFVCRSSEMDVWMVDFKTCTKRMSLCNANYDFQGAQGAYYEAVGLANAIELMSFGQNILNQADLYCENSNMLRERGSIGQSCIWAQKALGEANPDDKHQLINVLCNAVLAFSAKWNAKRAGEIAIQAVRMAKELFGTNHPNYLKALLHYCHYSNEFLQDDFGVEVGKKAVELSLKVYGTETIQVADMYRVLSKSLISCSEFTDEDYHKYALQAMKIAKENIAENHPKMALFRAALASALHVKAVNQPKSDRMSTLLWAESEAKACLNTYTHYFGDVCLKTAQCYGQLGQIYAKMERFEEAGNLLSTAVNFLSVCQPANSCFTAIAKATLGIFYRVADQPLAAVDLLQDVVDSVDSGGVHMKWLEMSYDMLISTLEALDKKDDAEQYKAKLTEWQKQNPKLAKDSWESLDAEPTQWKTFLEGFQLWQKQIDKVKENLGKLITDNKDSKVMAMEAFGDTTAQVVVKENITPGVPSEA